jgi:hypothetical protein
MKYDEVILQGKQKPEAPETRDSREALVGSDPKDGT